MKNLPNSRDYSVKNFYEDAKGVDRFCVRSVFGDAPNLGLASAAKTRAAGGFTNMFEPASEHFTATCGVARRGHWA